MRVQVNLDKSLFYFLDNKISKLMPVPRLYVFPHKSYSLEFINILKRNRLKHTNIRAPTKFLNRSYLYYSPEAQIMIAVILGPHQFKLFHLPHLSTY